MGRTKTVVMVAGCLLVGACGRSDQGVPTAVGGVAGASGSTAPATTRPSELAPTSVATTTPRAPTTVTVTAPPVRPITMSAKLRPYIDCLNEHSADAINQMRAYLRDADRASGPKPGVAVNISELADPQACVDGVQAAAAIVPSIPAMETAGRNYTAALTALVPVVKQAAVYYKQRDYKDDGGAKGRALHPGLVAAFDAFAAAHVALNDQVGALQRQSRLDDIAARQAKEGRSARVILGYSVLAAQDIITNTTVTWDELDRLDVAALTSSLAAYEALLDELDRYAASHKAEVDDITLYPLVVDDSRKFLIAGKELMRRARDHVPWSTGDKLFVGTRAEWMVDGSPGQLIDAYNRLVEMHNSLTRP